MIRLATQEDVPSLFSLVVEYTEQCPDSFTLNDDWVSTVIEKCVHEDDGLAVVAYNETDGVYGLLLGMFSYHPFFGYPMVTELIWYSHQWARGRPSNLKLLKAFLEWAEYKEAEWALISDVDSVQDNRKLYGKLGFEISEKTYMKRIK